MKLATSTSASWMKTSYERCIYLWLFYLTYYLEGRDASLSTSEAIENHLEIGRQLLARQQYNDALSHYHAAVDLDPKNYLTYFRRATVYLALGRSKSALEDLNQVIELKSDFLAARVQRGTILLKQGNLDEAHIDLEWVLRIDPYHEEATRLYTAIEPLKNDLMSAYELMEDNDHAAAIDILTKLVHELPWDVKVREMRAECYEYVGDIIHAISDLRQTTKLRSDNTEAFAKVSKLYYSIGETEESLNTIRECLKLDPDHKACFEHYKKVKKLVKQLTEVEAAIQQQQYDQCVERTLAALRTEKSVTRIIQMIRAKQCHCLNKANKSKEAVKACTAALEYDPHDMHVLCDRAEAYLQDDDFENAESDYQKAHNMDQHFGRAAEGLERVRKMIQQSKRRDYYKILGVKRTATKKEVTKAYRKLAQKWHPDNFQGDEKKEAEKKFIDIAAAKEVLTNPEKREKFDRGEDPLDPEAQANHHQNFWSPHGFPFGSDQFSFKFHFG